MKKARCWIVLMLVVLALVKSQSLVFAQWDSKFGRQTLRGLQGVCVFVEDLGPEIERSGLTTNQIRADKELKLRMAGIRVLSKEDIQSTPGVPLFSVGIQIHKHSYIPVYLFDIDLHLLQEVFLVRAPNIKTHATTWSLERSGINPELEDIRTITKDSVDRFINAYLSVNPK